MKIFSPPAVVIGPTRVSKPVLEDAIQAMRLVECILKVNDDATIEPGHLAGMSLMLANAERVLSEKRAALPAKSHSPRAPTSDSRFWPGIGQAFTLQS